MSSYEVPGIKPYQSVRMTPTSFCLIHKDGRKVEFWDLISGEYSESTANLPEIEGKVPILKEGKVTFLSAEQLKSEIFPSAVNSLDARIIRRAGKDVCLRVPPPNENMIENVKDEDISTANRLIGTAHDFIERKNYKRALEALKEALTFSSAPEQYKAICDSFGKFENSSPSEKELSFLYLAKVYHKLDNIVEARNSLAKAKDARKSNLNKSLFEDYRREFKDRLVELEEGPVKNYQVVSDKWKEKKSTTKLVGALCKRIFYNPKDEKLYEELAETCSHENKCYAYIFAYVNLYKSGEKEEAHKCFQKAEEANLDRVIGLLIRLQVEKDDLSTHQEAELCLRIGEIFSNQEEWEQAEHYLHTARVKEPNDQNFAAYTECIKGKRDLFKHKLVREAYDNWLNLALPDERKMTIYQEGVEELNDISFRVKYISFLFKNRSDFNKNELARTIAKVNEMTPKNVIVSDEIFKELESTPIRSANCCVNFIKEHPEICSTFFGREKLLSICMRWIEAYANESLDQKAFDLCKKITVAFPDNMDFKARLLQFIISNLIEEEKQLALELMESLKGKVPTQELNDGLLAAANSNLKNEFIIKLLTDNLQTTNALFNSEELQGFFLTWMDKYSKNLEFEKAVAIGKRGLILFGDKTEFRRCFSDFCLELYQNTAAADLQLRKETLEKNRTAILDNLMTFQEMVIYSEENSDLEDHLKEYYETGVFNLLKTNWIPVELAKISIQKNEPHAREEAAKILYEVITRTSLSKSSRITDLSDFESEVFNTSLKLLKQTLREDPDNHAGLEEGEVKSFEMALAMKNYGEKIRMSGDFKEFLKKEEERAIGSLGSSKSDSRERHNLLSFYTSVRALLGDFLSSFNVTDEEKEISAQMDEFNKI